MGYERAQTWREESMIRIMCMTEINQEGRKGIRKSVRGKRILGAGSN